MSDPTMSEDFNPMEVGMRISDLPSAPPVDPPTTHVADSQPNPLDRVMAAMRQYIDAQDEETRSNMDGMEQWLVQINHHLEALWGRVAALEAREGSEGYRQYLVAELRRISADKSG